MTHNNSIRSHDIVVDVFGGEKAHAKDDNTAPEIQQLVVSFDRPGRVEISVDRKSGKLLVHVYEGFAYDEWTRRKQSAKGGFGCNEGENDSWVWHEGENRVHTLPEKE